MVTKYNAAMSIIQFEEVEKLIVCIRDIQVILDSDVALLYGVETKRVNEAVKNNPEKFLDNYIFQLTKQEWQILKTKYSTSNKGGKAKIPYAFSEKGLYMLATILKSVQATQTTIAIIEAFSKIRNLSRNMGLLSKTNDAIQKEQLLQKSGEIITEILGNDLVSNETETTIELNFAVLKFKHTLKARKS